MREEMMKEISNFLECLCKDLHNKIPWLEFVNNTMYSCIAAYKHIDENQYRAVYGCAPKEKIEAIAVAILCITGNKLKVTIYEGQKDFTQIFDMDNPAFTFDVVADMLKHADYPKNKDEIIESFRKLINEKRR
jgi:hypothetical protein